MVVKYTPLQLWRAVMSHEPEKLCQHPSSKGMASVEGGEGYVGISVSQLAVRAKKYLNSSSSPSHHRLQSHVQVEEIDLFMATIPGFAASC